LAPEQIIEFKALKGDPSDNIAGVPGIGDKTARNLLTEYKTIDSIYDHLDQLKPKTAENLKNYRDQLFIGRELVTLRRDVPLDLDSEACRFGDPDYDLLLSLFEQLEFKSLINRLKANRVDQGELHKDQTNCYSVEEITDEAGLKILLGSLQNNSQVAICCEPEAGRPYWQQPLNMCGPGDRPKQRILSGSGFGCYEEQGSF
jgi:DNA polymerase I